MRKKDKLDIIKLHDKFKEEAHMNIKNNKGITFVALIITVVVLLIIATTTIRITTSMASTAMFENVESSLMIIQSKCKTIADKKAIGEIDESEVYGVRQGSGEYEGYYLLTQADLGAMGLQKLDAKEGYYINYDTEEVIYGKGISLNGTKYYKLSDMLNAPQK